MRTCYIDVLRMTNKAPTWWTEGGYPRWCEFNPDEVDDVYACEAVLMQIACQVCGWTFKVALSAGTFDKYKLCELINAGTIHYGDPPNTQCCMAGPTMNCEDIRIIEYWEFSFVEYKWKRNPNYEIELFYRSPQQNERISR